jgi:hypothetical protein
MVGQQVPLYIKALMPSVIGKMSREQALKVIKDHNQWEALSQHLMFISAKLFTYSEQLTAPSAYEVIRMQLLELMGEDERVRTTTTAERYIRDKTNLSRSGIMHIISKLKEGGFIEINRGILIKINRLPDKY